jgi:hypothetical protein
LEDELAIHPVIPAVASLSFGGAWPAIPILPYPKIKQLSFQVASAIYKAEETPPSGLKKRILIHDATGFEIKGYH